MRALPADLLEFAGIDCSRRQFGDPDLGIAADLPDPPENALCIGRRRIEYRQRLDLATVQFDKAFDRIEAVEGELLDRELGAERGRFPPQPCGARSAAYGPGAMDALRVPSLEPARSPGLRFVGSRRPGLAHRLRIAHVAIAGLTPRGEDRLSKRMGGRCARSSEARLSEARDRAGAWLFAGGDDGRRPHRLARRAGGGR